jgi:hypothetical protein
MKSAFLLVCLISVVVNYFKLFLAFKFQFKMKTTFIKSCLFSIRLIFLLQIIFSFQFKMKTALLFAFGVTLVFAMVEPEERKLVGI